MTGQTAPLTDQQLDDIETRAAHLYEYAQQHGDGEGDTLAGENVPALLAEVRRLRAELAASESDVALLRALEVFGVDNWEGYDDAIQSVSE